MTSPYLEKPLVPLCVALRRMLENVEVELASAKPSTEQDRLPRRAELIRSLLTPSPVPTEIESCAQSHPIIVTSSGEVFPPCLEPLIPSGNTTQG